MNITGIFDPENIVLAGFGYRISYLELVGTLLSLCSVWLAARNHILNWPVGNIAVIIFAVLFYRVQLYSDFVEQFYYLITGSYGWWVWWSKGGRQDVSGSRELTISRTSRHSNILCGAAICVGTLLLGHLMANIHRHLPQFFAQPAAFPYLDAFTTMMSFSANLLMVYRKMECWYLWIAVDIFGVALYFSRGIFLVSLLYVIFLALATQGYLRWRDQWLDLQTDAPGLSPS